ncbi:MAG: VOC family protein [Euryarchaeota archaeon]|nr:VOC family protein [Euryarchaeota archaeon]
MKPRRLERIVLYTRDPERMRAFYERILGFPVLGTDGPNVRLQAGAAEIVLQPDPPFANEEFRDFVNQLKGNMRGMGAVLQFEVDDVDRYFAELTGKGLVPVEPERNRRLDAPVVRADGRREFAIEDPEGYWLYFGTAPTRLR